MTYKNCSNCGRPNPMDNKFCASCGAVFRNMSPLVTAQESITKQRKPILVPILLAAILVVGILILVFMHSSQDAPPTDPTIVVPPTQTVPVPQATTPKIPEATVPPQTMPCSHSWAPADCDNPQICRNCGATTGSPVGHDWIDATMSAPKTCKNCGLEEGAPLENSLAELVRERLPIVTYAMTSTRLLYGYEDEALTKKNNSVYCEPGKGEIVITDISDDGTALKVRFRTYSNTAGYDDLWFRFEDIIQIEEVLISERSAASKMDTYKPFHSSYGQSRYGGMEPGWEFTYLGSHESGCYVITYPIYEQKVFGISVIHKIALVKTQP